MPELSTYEDVMKAFNDWKAINTQRLTEIKDGLSDNFKEQLSKVETDMFAKVDDVNKAIKERLDASETEVASLRRKLSGMSFAPSDATADKKTATYLRQFKAQYKHKAEATPQRMDEYRRCTEAYIRGGKAGHQPEYMEKVGGDSLDYSAVMQGGVLPEGGYFLAPPVRGRIVEKRFEISPMRRLASVATIASQSLSGIADYDEITGGWVGEKDTRSNTGEVDDLGEYEVFKREQYAYVKMPQRILDDADFDIEGWLIRKIGRALAKSEGTAFILGQHPKQPRGLLIPSAVSTADATRAWANIQYIASGGAGAYPSSGDVAGGLIATINALHPDFRNGANWLMSRATLGTTMRLQDANDNYFFLPNLKDDGISFTLLGYPVIEDENMPTIASDSLSIAFGNFAEAYQIVEGPSMRTVRDDNLTEPGYVKIYVYDRVGGDVVNTQAYKVVKFASS